MIDRWDEIIGKQSQSCQSLDVSLLYLFPFFCICFCVPKDYSYAAGWQVPASAHLSFFSSLLWFCHSEVHLSEEKPAALVELAVTHLGPGGDCFCSDVDVHYCTSGSVRLCPQKLLALLGDPPPPTHTRIHTHTHIILSAWLDWDSPKTARHQLQGCGSFLL